MKFRKGGKRTQVLEYKDRVEAGSDIVPTSWFRIFGAGFLIAFLWIEFTGLI